MSKIEKLLDKFKSNPTDFTWDDLVKILNYLGYFEKATKGKTGCSRIKFVNDDTDVISLHKPHPSNIVKQYVIKQIIEKLGL
jgi:predicted RNA binding protein YcfA (HicA-like mRNA interferase family)